MNSIEKPRCPNCGKTVHAAMSRRIKGLCLACFASSIQGKPKSLDDLDLILIHRVHDLDGGFDALSDPAKLYYAVGLLRNEVNNGGFHQYFFNSSGSQYSVVENGLIHLKAQNLLDLLREAKNLIFSDLPVPTNTLARRTLLLDHPDTQLTDKLDRLDQRFYRSPDEVTPKLNAFASEQGLIDPNGAGD